jgi:WD40 repeat protein
MEEHWSPLEQTLEGHSGWVFSVVFSRDGSKVVSGSNDSTARVWDAASGRQLKKLEGHSGSVYSVALSPDGSKVVSGPDDQTVRVWDAASGQQLKKT